MGFKNLLKIIWILFWVLIICFINYIVGNFDEINSIDNKLDELIPQIIIDACTTAIMLIICDLASRGIAFCIFKKFPSVLNKYIFKRDVFELKDYSNYSFLSLTEYIGKLILDVISLIFTQSYKKRTHKSVGYYNKANKNIVEFERYNDSRMSEFIMTDGLVKYRKWLDSSNNNRLITKNSKIYKIADVDNEGSRKLVRRQEVCGYNFGVVYENANKRVIINPVENPDESVFPYANNVSHYGIVVLLHYDSRYTLVKDEKNRYVFPSGGYKIKKGNYYNAKSLIDPIFKCIFESKDVKCIGTIIQQLNYSSKCVHVIIVELNQTPIAVAPSTKNEQYTIGELKCIIDIGSTDLLTKAVYDMLS